MKKNSYLYLFLWLITIFIAIGWTYENPEKISKFKDFIKYNLSLGKNFTSAKKILLIKILTLIRK